MNIRSISNLRMNETSDKQLKLNLLQCRLQTKGISGVMYNGRWIFTMFFVGWFMGGNVSLSIKYMIYVSPESYGQPDRLGGVSSHTMIGHWYNVFIGRKMIAFGPSVGGPRRPR